VNHINGVMVTVLASSAVDRGFEPRSGQTKDYENGICCFSATYDVFVFIRKRSRNQDNEPEYLPVECCFSELAL
jgi:hypothetical protein